ncbi:unnamed protein product [Calicophoron daubneyi]|uniref:L-type lectin-like domain-containing protein n=1 Tax=Calicophoron daubneyi TaxID=300641 RepID=A0AAV2T8Y3_CALDB
MSHDSLPQHFSNLVTRVDRLISNNFNQLLIGPIACFIPPGDLFTSHLRGSKATVRRMSVTNENRSGVKYKTSSTFKLLTVLWIFIQLSGGDGETEFHQEHSLGYTDSKEFWELQGTALFVDSGLQLTEERRYTAAVARNGFPVDYCDWIVDIKFGVYGNRIADGWAFFYTVEPVNLHSHGHQSAMGAKSKFAGLAVMFDTYGNEGEGGFPKLYPVLLDGSNEYVHHQNGKNQRSKTCNFREINQKCRVVIKYAKEQLWIEYYDSRGTRKCAIHHTHVVLPTGGYIGLSGLTGGSAEKVIIYSLKVEELVTDGSCDHRDNAKPKWRETK